MKFSIESSAPSRAERRILITLVVALIASAPGEAALAEARLTEGVFAPDIAARGFTGVTECTGISCLEWNPAFLYSEDESVRPGVGIGLRFNEALFNTVDNWNETKGVFGSERYREMLLKTWNFLSRQTAKVDTELGIRLESFAFSYSPGNFGAVLFTHDPVLPFGELYNYQFSVARLGYAHRVRLGVPRVKTFTVGAAINSVSATANKFVFNQISSQFDQNTKVEGQWIRARIGAAATLDTDHPITLAAAISGIPIHQKPIEYMPSADTFDFQPGASMELGRLWWGNIRAHYSLSRIFHDESIWLKQHLGVEGTIGKFQTSIGVSDAMLSYGLSLNLPLFKFSVATYGVEYSPLVHNVTDRVYWFKLEI